MKKLLLTVLILILAFSTIAASLASVNALKVGDTTSFWSGRAGITFVDSRMSGTVTVTRKDPDKYKVESSPEFVQRLLDVRMVDRNDNRIRFVTGPVYVYYKVTDRELRALRYRGLAPLVLRLLEERVEEVRDLPGEQREERQRAGLPDQESSARTGSENNTSNLITIVWRTG